MSNKTRPYSLEKIQFDRSPEKHTTHKHQNHAKMTQKQKIHQDIRHTNCVSKKNTTTPHNTTSSTPWYITQTSAIQNQQARNSNAVKTNEIFKNRRRRLPYRMCQSRNSNQPTQLDELYRDAGNLWARFEYFQIRFALQPIPVLVTQVPDRVQRPLSISRITFFSHCSMSLQNTKYCKKRLKKMQQ